MCPCVMLHAAGAQLLQERVYDVHVPRVQVHPLLLRRLQERVRRHPRTRVPHARYGSCILAHCLNHPVSRCRQAEQPGVRWRDGASACGAFSSRHMFKRTQARWFCVLQVARALYLGAQERALDSKNEQLATKLGTKKSMQPCAVLLPCAPACADRRTTAVFPQPTCGRPRRVCRSRTPRVWSRITRTSARTRRPES